jgi:hypothetical protein
VIATEETTVSGANEQWVRPDTDIHTWFSLTYANYLVLPRSLLQSLPEEMQYRLTEVLDEIGDLALANDVPFPDYRVQTVDDRGRYMRDPVPHYNRGRTKIDLSASA